MTGTTLSGACFCGAVRYQATGPFRNLCLCHCQSCRRAAGAPLVAWFSVNKEDFVICDGKLTQHNSSEGVERGFCNYCGTTITYYNALRSKDMDITLASLDDPEALAPKIQIFIEDKLSWIDTNPDLPQYQTVPEQGD